MKLIKMSDKLPPVGKKVLLYWDDMEKHFEDGVMEKEGVRGDIPDPHYFVVYFGETHETAPSHWAEIDFKED